jgi:hypothetical protein
MLNKNSVITKYIHPAGHLAKGPLDLDLPTINQ